MNMLFYFHTVNIKTLTHFVKICWKINLPLSLNVLNNTLIFKNFYKETKKTKE